MKLESLTSEDLIEVLRQYLRNFDCKFVDCEEDSITITLNDDKHIYINIGLDTGEIDD